VTFNRSLFKSERTNWGTPSKFYKELDKEFHFTFDPCPLKKPDWDGLQRTWHGRVFVNPPYGRTITMWIRKAIVECSIRMNCEVCVMLLPSRTDTKWWHDLVMEYGTEIRFIRGRLRFRGARSSAPFPSCVVIFRAGKRPTF